VRGGADLSERFAGDLIWPHDRRYKRARALFNLRVDTRPALIARCRRATDVVEALHWARERGREVAVRATGLNYAGWATADNGVVIDLSPMRHVMVDAATNTARVQGGALNGDLQKQAYALGLAAATGASSALGLGLMLGGGSGYLRRRAGWATDHILEAEVVTADGRVVVASAERDADLLWALRGAGPNFGVVTSLVLGLHRAPARLRSGVLVWGTEKLREAMRALRFAAENVSDDLAMFSFLKVPDVDSLALEVSAENSAYIPSEIRSGPSVEMWFGHLGNPERAHAELQLVRDACRPDFESAGPTGWGDLHSWVGVPPARVWADAISVRELADDVIDVLHDIVQDTTTPGTKRIELLDQRGGLSREPEYPTALRRPPASAWSARVQASCHGPELDADCEAWVRKVISALRGTSAAAEDVCLGSTMSYPADAERVAASYGGNYERLQQLKRAYDPDNVFHRNLNIRPAAT
jgi:FAD/FMN-containing dehydrogenase